MPEGNHYLIACRGLAALLAAASSSPLQAEQVSTYLTVRAVVIPTCQVSTAPGRPTADCSAGAEPAVTRERRILAVGGGVRTQMGSGPGRNVTVVTITY